MSLFLPPHGAHRADPPLPFIACPPFPTVTSARRTRPYLTDVIAADGLPLGRPYVAVWERERDERERRYHVPWEAAA
ncbi:hypothetical protein [Streptomyces griseochromogenes]|uniref:hypothetical protein n=1 Tax=Streptomyces griseochromogenes TaxID=68214 RepID=UPI0037A9DF49